MSEEVEEAVIEARKWLLGYGLDAGAASIYYRLRDSRERPLPSEATIWRVLQRRGFITPEPGKRPHPFVEAFRGLCP